MKFAVTLLVENTARGPGVLGEHGLSWWIEAGERSLLFDTGQGMVIEHNAEKLGISLERADAIVLSHGHYDHVGGLGRLLQRCVACPIWVHPAALEMKFSGTRPESVRCISIPLLHEEKLGSVAGRIRDASRIAEVIPGVFLTGEIPRRHSFEDTGGPFYLDAGCQKPDPITDDLALYFETAGGVVVVLGCAHSGVLNTLEFIAGSTGKPICAVMGGMHLEKASETRMRQTVEGLRCLGVREIYPCHCTGHAAGIALHNALPGVVRHCAASSRWFFEGAQ